MENCTANNVEYSGFLGSKIVVQPWEAIVTFFLITIMITTMVIGNIFVILCIHYCRTLHIIKNLFVMSLAVADLFIAILVIPFHGLYYVEGWKFGPIACKLWISNNIFWNSASILNVCNIALDRYWIITDPINYSRKRTMERAKKMISLVWMLSAIISLPPLLSWNNFKSTGHSDKYCEPSTDMAYVIYSSSLSFWIPLIIMTNAYARIFIEIRQRFRERTNACMLNITNVSPKSMRGQKGSIRMHESNRSHTDLTDPNFQRITIEPKEDSSQEISSVPSPSPPVSNRNRRPSEGSTGNKFDITNDGNLRDNSVEVSKSSTSISEVPMYVQQLFEQKESLAMAQERKTAYTLMIIMGVFVLCWLPFFFVYTISPFVRPCLISRRFKHIVMWIGYNNSGLNPIIYTYFNVDFRRAYKNLWRNKRFS